MYVNVRQSKKTQRGPVWCSTICRWLMWHPRVKFEAIHCVRSPWNPPRSSSPLKNLLYLLYTFSHSFVIKLHVCGFMKQAWEHGVMTWCKPHLGFLRQVSDPITAFPQHITPFCPGMCYKKLYVVRCEEMVASKPQAQHLCNKPRTPNSRSGTKMQEIFPKWLTVRATCSVGHLSLFLFSSQPQSCFFVWLTTLLFNPFLTKRGKKKISWVKKMERL